MAIQIIPNEVIEYKITDIMNSALDVRGLFTVDNSLAIQAGMKKRIYKYTYAGTVETLQKGAKSSVSAYGSTTTTYNDYTVVRKQHAFKYNDEDVMSDGNIMNVLTNGAGTTMANDVRTDYFAELANISNTFDGTEYDSLYEAVVDAVADLPKASEKDITELFIIMGKDGKAKIRKDPLFEASKQGEILYTGQFGTVCGIPCVYSNLVPANTLYLTEKSAITYFVKKEGEVESERDIDSKDNLVVYTRYGLVALTDDTRSAVISF